MDSSDHLQKLGQQAYKRRNLHAALCYFNSVISQEKKPAITILDNRAATYEKLGDLDAALKDGRQMISDHKTSCSGYLRTGKILQLQGRYKVALDIYQYGLRNVPPSDSSFKLLRQMHDEVSRWSVPPKARDPLTILPAEIAEMVIKHLDFRQIVSLTRVSARWQEYLKSVPSLWTKLDFSAAKASIPKSAIRKYLRFSRGDATELVLNRFVAQQERFLTYVATVCRKLENLRLDNGFSNESLIKAVSIADNLQTLILSKNGGATLDCVSQILGRCPTLVRAEFYSIRAPVGDRRLILPSRVLKLQALTLQLEEVYLPGPGWVRAEELTLVCIDSLLVLLPDIQELSLANWSAETTIPSPGKVEMCQLQKLELVNYQGNISPQSLPSLRFLSLRNCPKVFAFVQGLGFKPDLRESGYVGFSAPHAGLDAEMLLQLIGPRTEDLRHLDISHCVSLEECHLANIVSMGYIDQVVDLDLSGLNVTDKIIELLVPRAQRLTNLKLASTNITGISVKALITKADNKLIYLDIRDCDHISSDAVPWPGRW